MRPGGYEPPDESRWVIEPSKRANRSSFARDRARVLHSAAWRRLAAKTQIMIAGEGDFPRTRMTHSLECAQIGRELGGSLGCDPDLVETACLAHDLGHPPFGHNGEGALDAFCASAGGFEGNAQTLRILTRLEAKSFGDPMGTGTDRPVGLNMTRAALDAASKYPWRRPDEGGKFGVYTDDLPVFEWVRAGAPGPRRSFEAQVMDWADDVAYSVHDVEDGIHAGFIDVRALRDTDIGQAIAANAVAEYLPGADPEELLTSLARLVADSHWPTGYEGTLRDLAALKDLTSHLIGRFTAAAQEATQASHGLGRLTRYSANLVVPEHIRAEVAVLKSVANLFVVRRSGSQMTYDRQQSLMLELADAIHAGAPATFEPHLRPAWAAATDDAAGNRVVADQIASLTDISVMSWHARLCGESTRVL